MVLSLQIVTMPVPAQEGITRDNVTVRADRPRRDQDVALPESMKRSMSRQAEAERERRSRVITADGELQASRTLAEAVSRG